MRVEAQKLIEIQDLFPDQDPAKRSEYLQAFDKKQLLQILASINCYPGKSIDVDYSKVEQENIIDWLFRPCQLCIDHWLQKISGLTQGDYFPPVFHRAANLVAIEEIMMSNLPDDGGQPMTSCKTSQLFLMYYLSINSLLVQQQQFIDNEELTLVEKIIGGIAASNELNLPYYPEQDIIRSQQLIDFLAIHESYGNLTTGYFQNIGVNSERYSIWGFKYITQIQRNHNLRPPVCIASTVEDQILLDRFSTGPILEGQSSLETVNVKKRPFWRMGEGQYLLLDIPFLVDKGYHSIVNDLWFDTIRPAGFERSHYIGEIGLFFEDYVGEKIVSTFSNSDAIVKVTDNLKLDTGNGQIELADFYARKDDQVLLGQVKVSAVNSRDRYTYEEGNLFKVDKKNFYKTFGLIQMVENTLQNLLQDPSVFDIEFPKDGYVSVYPTLVVNERLLLSPMMNLAFQEYFHLALKDNFEENVVIPENIWEPCLLGDRYRVFPVVLIYVAELELIEITCSGGTTSLFELLEAHIEKTRLWSNFTRTINQNIGQAYKTYLMQTVFPILSQLVED